MGTVDGIPRIGIPIFGAKLIGVFAWCAEDEKPMVNINQVDPGKADDWRAGLGALAWELKAIDWQADLYDTIDEARIALKELYGAVWARAAHQQLEALACMWADEREGFEAFPSGRFADAMRGTKSFPANARCPYKLSARVSAWHRGYDLAHERCCASFEEEAA